MTSNLRTNIVPAAERHIVAIGGSSQSAPGRTGRILEYLLGLSPDKQNQRIPVVDTATGDDNSQKLGFYDLWNSMNTPCSLSFLRLFERTPVDLKALLLRQDIMFVGGGNTKSMLAVWQAYGIDHHLRQAWEHGVVLAGSSAGGICWFESCVTDSWADSFTSLPALGILKGSCCPHYDGEAGRRDTYHAMVSSGELPDGYAIDEATAIHFVGMDVHEVVTVSPKKDASAYRVTANGGSSRGCCGDCGGDCVNGGVEEVALPAIRLD